MREQLENLGERLRGKTYPPCFRLSVHAKQPFFHDNHFFKFCLASTDDQKIIEKDIIIRKAGMYNKCHTILCDCLNKT